MEDFHVGSFSSGRWRCYQKKTTTQACLILDVADLVRRKILRDSGCSGTISWHERASVGFKVLPNSGAADDGTLELSYCLGKEEVRQLITFEKTQLSFGKRLWFQCPTLVDGESCRRRCGKLYLPPQRLHFACRHCHALTYRSSQEHDKRVNNPESIVGGFLKGREINLVLALKSLNFFEAKTNG